MTLMGVLLRIINPIPEITSWRSVFQQFEDWKARETFRSSAETMYQESYKEAVAMSNRTAIICSYVISCCQYLSATQGL